MRRWMRGVRRMRRLGFFKDLVEGNRAAQQVVTQRFLLQWHVTERCNNRCSHCYQESYGGAELSFDELTKVVDQYRELLDMGRQRRGHINITGGEPFLREDFFDFLAVLAGESPRLSFAVLTNGSLVDDAAARRLASLKPAFVQVSLDGNEESHDRIRGKGDFRRTVKALGCLRTHGIRTMVSFTAHRGNYLQFGEVVRQAARFRVSRIWADRFIPCGGAREAARLVLAPEETRDFFHALERARRRAKHIPFFRTEVAASRALQFLASGGEPYRCVAGDTLLTVQADGDVVSCRRMPIPVGNVTTASLARIYRDSDLLAALRDRDRVSEGCEGCFYARLCRGGLRCLAYAMTGDPFRRDPGCWMGIARHRGGEPGGGEKTRLRARNH